MSKFIALTKYDRNRFDDEGKQVHLNTSMIAVMEQTGPSTSITLQNVLEPLHVQETPAQIFEILGV